MNPEQLSVKNTEHGHQTALFAWAAMAQQHGFAFADEMNAYTKEGLFKLKSLLHPAYMPPQPVSALEWLHSIPNGGLRDARTAAMMKAEGARSGVADVFLPVPRRGPHPVGITYCGLYIEMKKPKGGVQSPAQKAFETHCNQNAYLYRLCLTWREAADTIKEYLS